jgi:Protein of unknown function (DUF2530)
VKIYLRSNERRPDPPPLQTDDRQVVLIGTAVWTVLLVLAVIFHDRLAADGRGWWVWTPVVGIALGLYGLRYLRRQGGSAQG